eukprot:gene16050-19037_t
MYFRTKPALAEREGTGSQAYFRYYYKEICDEDMHDVNGGAPGDFFELLNVELGADSKSVKTAYRSLQRLVHPDIAGERAEDLAVLLNSAYATLSDKDSRTAYAAEVKRFRAEEGGSFTGHAVSEWRGHPGEQRAVFVDESVCIGCMNCTYCAPNTFYMEGEYGRARVSAQWADEEEAIREAVDICPVDCIFFVKRAQLALLEFTMKACKREDIAIMARRRSGNMGPGAASESPFVRAEVFLKYRAEARVGGIPAPVQIIVPSHV